MNPTQHDVAQTGTNVLVLGAPPRTDTELLLVPWLLPPVTATYRTPRARLAQRLQRAARSRLMADLNPLARTDTFATVVALAAALLGMAGTGVAGVTA